MQQNRQTKAFKQLLYRIPLTTLQRMFVLFGFIMLVVCVIFFSIFSYVYRRNIREIVADEMKSNLARIDEYIGLMVQNSDNVSNVLTNNSFLQQYIVGSSSMVSSSNFKDFDALLKNITNSTEFISSIDLYVHPHQMLFMSDFGATGHLDNEVISFLDEVTAGNESFHVRTDYRNNIGTLFTRSINNITMIRPLYSLYTGEKAGFLAVNIEPFAFQRVLRSMQGSQCILIDSENQLIADSPLETENELLIKDNHFLVPLTDPNTVTFQRIDGREYVFVTANIDAMGWRLVSFASTDALVEKGTGLHNYLISLILVMIFFWASAVILLMRLVFRRIHVLVDLMERVKGGNFQVAFRPQSTDEFSYLFASFNSMLQNVDTLFNENYRLELMHKDAQLRLLQNQMNPHFIYNIFNDMNWLIQLKRYDELELLVESVAVFYSRSLNDGKMLISVRGSMEKLQSYVQIQQIRFRDRFICEMRIQEEILDAEILNHMIQPLLENAFAHGVEPVAGKYVILIEGRKVQNDLFFTVSDDGAGIAQDRLLDIRKSFTSEDIQGEFFALQNVSHRIKMYYGDSYGLLIDSTEGSGTTATIRIPYQKLLNKTGGGINVSNVDC